MSILHVKEVQNLVFKGRKNLKIMSNLNLHSSIHNSQSCIENVSGVILAGGKSIRYGKNKAMGKINGTTLIEKVIRVMQPLFEELVLITNTPDEYSSFGLPMHEDLIKGLGPLGGIYTALTSIGNDTAFFVACDMPYLNQELIRYMTGIRDDFDAVIPKISWKIEPLHAIYTKSCLPAIRKSIASRSYKIMGILPEVSVRYVGEDEIRASDPELRCFFNVNRPQDLRRMRNL